MRYGLVNKLGVKYRTIAIADLLSISLLTNSLVPKLRNNSKSSKIKEIFLEGNRVTSLKELF